MSTKRILSLVLALVMVLGTFGTVFAAEPTSNDKVNKLIELLLVKGDEKGDYRLADTIRRDEVAAMVVRSMDLEAVAEAMKNVPTKFGDVKVGDWNNGYVAVAEGRGITKGTSANTFAPARPITYSEVAAMLVRVIGVDAKEEANYTWPASYVAKAHEMGILKDVAITNMGEMAIRERVFEMVYNTINNKNSNLLIANTVEGMVVENYRTESLNKDEIIVHVMKDQVEKSGGKYDAGQEFRVILDKELKAKGLDVETLLGKVVAVSFDKADKVVDVKVVDGYTYVQGKVNDITSKDIKVAGKWYTIGKEEARTDYDERLYQVYFNNEDTYYERTYDYKADKYTAKAEYAKLTVKNGKVLFIDSFKFDDIAPVAKDADKNVVVFYDDADGGETRKLTVNEKAFVINFEKNEVNLGNNEEIKANDVIHWFTDYKKNVTVFVRPSEDNKVEGVYKDASASRAKDADVIDILVDTTEYPANISTTNRNPVYSTLTSESIFETLTDNYDIELEGFEKEEVTILLDMFGSVQLIGSETVDGSFYAVISNTSRSQGEVKLVKADNTNTWYGTDRDTVFKGAGVPKSTKDKQFDVFGVNDLVKVNSTDTLINTLERLTGTSAKVESINKNIIDFSTSANPVAGTDYFYNSKNAVVFVALSGKTPVAMDIATFIKDYWDPSDVKNTNYNPVTHEIQAYVAETSKDDVAKVIVVTMATKVGAGTDDVIAKVTKVRFAGTTYWLDVQYGDKTTARHEVTGNVYKVNNTSLALNGVIVAENDIVELTLTKNDAKDITDISLVNLGAARKVTKYAYDTAKKENFVQFADSPVKVWISRTGDTFGDIEVGSYVRYEALDKYDTTAVITVVSKPSAPAPTNDGKLAAAWKLTSTEIMIRVDGVDYEYAGPQTLTDLQLKIGTVVTLTKVAVGSKVIVTYVQ